MKSPLRMSHERKDWAWLGWELRAPLGTPSGHDLRADALERRREIGTAADRTLTAATGLSTLSETLREEVDGFVTSIRAA